MLANEIAKDKVVSNITVCRLIMYINFTDGTTISVAVGEDGLSPMATVNGELQVLERDK